MLCSLIKLTAEGSRLNTTRFSPHSLLVGGLVSLFAANVPDHLKQLPAGEAIQCPLLFMLELQSNNILLLLNLE